jgi:hypothetical protein
MLFFDDFYFIFYILFEFFWNFLDFLICEMSKIPAHRPHSPVPQSTQP